MKIAEVCKITVPKGMVYSTPKQGRPTKRAQTLAMIQEARQKVLERKM